MVFCPLNSLTRWENEIKSSLGLISSMTELEQARNNEHPASSNDGWGKDTRVLSFGCRLNTFEAEAMREAAGRAGLGNTIIFNTCAVTGEAVRQGAQAIRRARRDNPSARIVVTGCAAQIEPERFAQMPEVDHVIGNGEKLKVETFAALAHGHLERLQVTNMAEACETAGRITGGFGMPRAFVQVQNGCDHHCTFCVIPFGRGPSRSVPAGGVVAQVRKLIEAGAVEIVLSGVDLTAYGADLPGNMTLGKLVRKLLKLLPELRRLRLSSIDQVEADADLMRAIAEEERLMPHLHLSLQAGDDLILKRMKRRHNRAEAVAFCREARRLRPDIVFGADLIAGFPTETEEMFMRTHALADDCELTYLHIFPFSPRPGTPAALMPQVPRPIIKERASRLRHAAARRRELHFAAEVGRNVEIMYEQPGLGRTKHYAEVEAPKGVAGAIAQLMITGYAGGRLLGAVAT